MFSELMRLYCPRIKCCDKLMALLLFYSVIKFLLITLTQRSSKGHAVSWEAAHRAKKGEGVHGWYKISVHNVQHEAEIKDTNTERCHAAGRR